MYLGYSCFPFFTKALFIFKDLYCKNDHLFGFVYLELK